jgi:hypothetical protein
MPWAVSRTTSASERTSQSSWSSRARRTATVADGVPGWSRSQVSACSSATARPQRDHALQHVQRPELDHLLRPQRDHALQHVQRPELDDLLWVEVGAALGLSDGSSSRVYPATTDFVPLVTAYGCTCRPRDHEGIRAAQRPFPLAVAEGQGFEPWSEVTPRSGFQDRRTRPLCEPSYLRVFPRQLPARDVGPRLAREAPQGRRPASRKPGQVWHARRARRPARHSETPAWRRSYGRGDLAPRTPTTFAVGSRTLPRCSHGTR